MNFKTKIRDVKSGIQLIAEERQEQISKHGRTIERDATENRNFQLSDAAAILCNVDLDGEEYDPNEYVPAGWNVDLFYKMMCKPYKERLVIVGALVAAEIDRINYMEANTQY